LRYELLQSDCTEQGFVVAVGASHAAFVPWDRVRYIVTDRRGYFNGLLMTQGLRTTPVALLRDGLDESFAAPPQRQFRKPTRRTLDLSVRQRNALTEELRTIIAKGYSEHPMKDVAEKLGYKYTYLRYWFESECRQISQLHRQWVLAQRVAKEKHDAELATQLVRTLYSTQAHVTRRHIERRLREVSLSLANPVVREAANRVKVDYFSAGHPPRHCDSSEAS
ncbi:hypothetical protein, partial [Burkholderia anthina]|uniref:hypothetical protein n=1 Tax=Burkholderia anthina TaxID=179879 RepID=UPI001ABA6250